MPQVYDIPVLAREQRLRSSLDYLKEQLDYIDGNKDGFVPAGGIILMFSTTMKVLSFAETRTLAEYVIAQSGQPVHEVDINSNESLKSFLEQTVRVSFLLMLLEQLLQIRF